MPISAAEKATHISHLRDLLQETDAKIWQQDSYPVEHRPDVSSLIDGLDIVDEIPAISFPLHPKMKPEWLQANIAANKKSANENKKKAAQYDFERKLICVRASLMTEPEAVIRRVITHEVAHGISDAMQFVSPTDYPPDVTEHVNEMIANTFGKKQRPPLEVTKIAKIGFSLTLFVGNYSVANFYEKDNLGEIYPTMIELITAQAMITGNISELNDDIAAGSVKALPKEDHPRFAGTFFRTAKNVPWIRQLDAFKTGNQGIAANILANGSTPGIGYARFSSLKESMELDESSIEKRLGIFT